MPARRTRKNPRKRTLSKRVNRLERISRPEVKYVDDESGAFDNVNPVSTPGYGTLITPQSLAQGSGRNARIGDKVKSRNIRFQGIFKMPQNPTNPTCALRILVLRCKGERPTTTQMPTWYGSVDEDKFFVLKDIMTQVTALQARTVSGSSFETGSSLKKIKFNVSGGMRKLQYNGGSDQRPLNNEIIIYLLAENASAEMAYTWKHYYVDN